MRETELDKKLGMIDLREHFDLIVLWLVKHGNMSSMEAFQKVSTMPPFSEPLTDKTDDLIFHDEPYYWAMSLLHGQSDPPWFTNPDLWPIPDAYHELEQEYVRWRKSSQQNFPFLYEVLLERFVPHSSNSS